MSTIDDDLVAVFGMTEAEAEAIMARAKAGQLTDDVIDEIDRLVNWQIEKGQGW